MDTLIISESDLRGYPGTASGEFLKVSHIEMYLGLSNYENWRTLLSNSNTCTFTLDDFIWSCVDQYLMCKKFKHDNTMVDALKSRGINGFACAAMAKQWSRTLSTDVLDEFTQHRSEYEYNALMAKFSQNSTLSQILLLTCDANLVRVVRYEGIVDCAMLMKVRDELRSR